LVKKWKVKLPKLTGEKERRAYIYLPDSYHKNPDQRYPVLYMFDGHNVFFDSDATYGKSWGMNKFMRKSKKQLIIVAVECNHEGNGRLVEYSPFSYENDYMGKIKGKGNVYMQWLVHFLKPYIDSHYRTLPDRMNTAICGSSMGGLMALFAVCQYNSIFGKAACLSPSLWVDMKQSSEMIQKAKMLPDTNIYLDYGEKELSNHGDNRSALGAALTLLLEKNVNLAFRIIPGGEHCEASWEKQIPIFMQTLEL